MGTVLLTRRALLDIAEIEAYSVEQWGKLVADAYLQSLQDALNLIRVNPGLLKPKRGMTDCLLFYRVRRHFLACVLSGDLVCVLTVKHGDMDLPSRIAEMEPQLLAEAKLLNQAWKKRRKQ